MTDRLSLDELSRLAVLARGGDMAARNRIVEDNMPIVAGIARRMCGSGMEFRDALQEGAIGMMKAAQTCDPARADCFPKYAILKVEAAILNARPRHAEMIRVQPYDKPKDGPSPVHRVGLDDAASLHLYLPDDDDDGESVALAWRLDAAIRSLPPDAAEAIERIYGLNGREPEEPMDVAAAMGKTKHVMHSWCQRLRRRIKNHMERQEAV